MNSSMIIKKKFLHTTTKSDGKMVFQPLKNTFLTTFRPHKIHKNAANI